MMRFKVISSILVFLTGTRAAVIPRSSTSPDDRSWEAAVQDINGMISILTLLPVLTGKSQNIKLIASRILPASFVLAGIGAGRVLAKLQVGILLFSFDLYRNTVGDLSYPHDEYVNKFSPSLNHLPTNTPERHATGKYINHNPSEVYMVEAWFRTQGQPSTVILKQNSNSRLLCGCIIYLLIYASESYLAVRNAAIGSENVYLVIQSFSVFFWIAATVIVQVRRGQEKREVELNRLQSAEYRCFELPMLGHHVSSVILSFHLNNLREYRLFQSDYEQYPLAVAGIIILMSGVFDIVSTVIIVGKTTWAYPWIALELVIILTKIVFCVEPLRHAEIQAVRSHGQSEYHQPKNQIPLIIRTSQLWTCKKVYPECIILEENATNVSWRSNSAGIWIGQEYYSGNSEETKIFKYLGFVREESKDKLGLLDEIPQPQNNQALQREFLASLAVAVDANCCPSVEFITTIQETIDNIKLVMDPVWYKFGSKDVETALIRARRTLLWRRWL